MTNNHLEITEVKQFDGKMSAFAHFRFRDGIELFISALSPYGNIDEFDCATLYSGQRMVAEARHFREGRSVFYSPDGSINQSQMARYWTVAATYSTFLNETHPDGEYRDLWDIATQGGALRRSLKKEEIQV